MGGVKMMKIANHKINNKLLNIRTCRPNLVEEQFCFKNLVPCALKLIAFEPWYQMKKKNLS